MAVNGCSGISPLVGFRVEVMDYPSEIAERHSGKALQRIVSSEREESKQVHSTYIRIATSNVLPLGHSGA